MTPLISIVVPVYQVEDYIANTIESVVNQSYPSFEVVLVNDGTKDRSIDIALPILNSSNVRYTLVNQDNKGLAAARNAGIRKSTGKWIICVDSDDIIAPEFLERLFEAGNKYSTDVVSCSFQSVDAKNIFKKPAIKGKNLILNRNEILISFLKRKFRIIAPGMLMKKEFLEKNNLWYDESIKYSEDQHFIWRVLLSANRVTLVKDQLYNYLNRDNSIMTSSNIKKVLTGYIGFKQLEKEIKGFEVIKKYILPRWIFGALHASSLVMDFNSFNELADEMDYKMHCRRLLLFPDLRIVILSFLLLVNLRLFYRIVNLLK